MGLDDVKEKKDLWILPSISDVLQSRLKRDRGGGGGGLAAG